MSSKKTLRKRAPHANASASTGTMTFDAYVKCFREMREARKKLLDKIAVSNPRLVESCRRLFESAPGAPADPAKLSKMLSTEDGFLEYLAGLSFAQVDGFIAMLKGKAGEQYPAAERAVMIRFMEEFRPLAFEHERELYERVLPLSVGIAEAMLLRDQLNELQNIHAQLVAASGE